VLFTDYGWNDPYVGQIKAVMAQEAPGVSIIDLLHAVPDFNARAGAHLLDALSRFIPVGAVFFCVVDPGVGMERDALVLEADGRWFVGPDNGLLSIVVSRAERSKIWKIHWRPERLSASFHGRDVFAPIAARIAAGLFPHEKLTPIDALAVQFDLADLPCILYIDHYGNAWTGIRGGLTDSAAKMEVNGHTLIGRRVFAEAKEGEVFWYVNSVGLIEIAANQVNAAAKLGLKVGDWVGRISGAHPPTAPAMPWSFIGNVYCKVEQYAPPNVALE
jgi:hypothetical protein